ncbi:transcriptional regulator [Bacillus sp. FJAT-49736]|uniref:transcriptional regulator n=1 Tax=Bacillus sp. FJAT-49736 TaxID=2833582 RepID=UPI001BC95F5B|nr:transcriptional regulator [Bacillus sp. FJAT-49736]MBS4173482.1 transcriptional regulator [Bacillus sp. FJAT-49736]
MTTATPIKLKKATFKHIESELYMYHETVKEIKTLRDNIMFCNENTDENIGGGRSSFISDPTGRTATALLTNRKLQNLESVAYAIETVYNTVNDDYKKLIRLKYWTRPQTKTWDGIAEELHVSRRQAFYWRDEIILAIGEILGWR